MRAAVVSVITVVILMLIGIIVVTNLINSVTPDTNWSASANTTWTNTQSYTWTAFGLIAIGIVILGAVAILATLQFGSRAQ